jgi:hypothetical protein
MQVPHAWILAGFIVLALCGVSISVVGLITNVFMRRNRCDLSPFFHPAGSRARTSFGRIPKFRPG